MQVEILTDKYKVQLNKLATHPVQSWEWGVFRESMGNMVLRVGGFEKQKLVEVHTITIHKIPHTKYKIGMLLKSSIPSNDVFEFLKDYCKKNNIVFVRMEPNVLNNVEIKNHLYNAGCIVGKRFFTEETFWVDLSKPEANLLSKMHSKTRYNIRLAQKHGVTVSEEITDEAFETYLTLTEETTKRQNFFAHTRKYHKAMWKILHASGIAHLMVARYNGEILTTWILFQWHDFLYYPYGASSEKYKNVMAPNLMMWESILFGKKNRLTTFDLWGKEEGRGFTRFKEGFGPDVVEFIGTWDFAVDPLKYKLYRVVENIRAKLLKFPLPIFKPSFS